MENNELKTRSMRIDNENYEKFKTLADEFPNQAQALSALLSVYEIEKSKAIMPERQTEIETFSMHMQKLNEIYNTSLILNKDAETRIRAEFERQLISKDTTIQDLQERIKKAEINAKEYEEQKQKIKKLDSEINAGVKTINEQTAEKKKLQHTVDSLTDMVDEYKQKAKENEALKVTITELEKQITELQHKRDASLATAEQYQKDLETAAERHNEELKTIKNDHDKNIKHLDEHKDIEKERIIIALERAHNEKINTIYTESQKRIEELLKQIEDSKKALIAKEPAKPKNKTE